MFVYLWEVWMPRCLYGLCLWCHEQSLSYYFFFFLNDAAPPESSPFPLPDPFPFSARRLFKGPPPLSADSGVSKTGDQRVSRRRRKEFLRAWRHRLPRHGARRGVVCAELWFQPP